MAASAVVTVVATFDIRPDCAKQFRVNCEAMIALREKEPGHLASAYSFDGDSAATSREDYENADAVIQHMTVGQHIYESTRSLVDITGVEIHGPAAELDKLRDLFGDMSPRFYITEYGFRR